MSDDSRPDQERAPVSPDVSSQDPEPAGLSSDAPPPTNARKHSKALIVLCVLLGLAVVGLAVWGFSAQSDADDAEAKLKDQQQAAAAATPEPSTASDDAKAAFERIATELGATNESIDDIQAQIDAAKQRVDDAEQRKDDASGAIDTAKAELESFKAKAEQASTCLKGSLEALGAAVEAGGVDAAVQDLDQIAGSCQSAAAP